MKHLLKQYEQSLKRIDAIDALDHLCWIFNSSYETVYVDGTRFALVDLFDFSQELIWKSATEIKLRFFGGPTRNRWYSGNLLNYLVDRLLKARLNNEFSKINKLFSKVNV
jgi:hypothetical protein